MKILLHYPKWSNRWIPYIEKELSRYDLTVTSTNEREELFDLSKQNDVLFSMWANEIVWFWSKVFPDKKIISYLRRYELFNDSVFNKTSWDKVDALIFVNNRIRDVFNDRVQNKPIKTHVLYNGIDLDEFDFDTTCRDGTKIAMVCTIKQIKNLPLACQVLLNLPEKYKIYHIGKDIGMGINELYYYVDGLGLSERFIFEGKIDPKDISTWMQDKDFILSTSINEGNPVNVLEGMAMGLKPIVHNWPDAMVQFGSKNVFNTVKEAIDMILVGNSTPLQYRAAIERKFNVSIYKQLHNIISEL